MLFHTQCNAAYKDSYLLSVLSPGLLLIRVPAAGGAWSPTAGCLKAFSKSCFVVCMPVLEAGLIRYLVLWGWSALAFLTCPGSLRLHLRGEEEDLDCVEGLSL